MKSSMGPPSAIRAIGSLHERQSVKFKEHEKKCFEFASLLERHQGKVKGSYGAWSYHIEGMVLGTENWLLKIERAVYSNSNIL